MSKFLLTKTDKEQLKKWFEQPVKYSGHTIQLIGATDKQWEKFCKLADEYVEQLKLNKNKEMLKWK